MIDLPYALITAVRATEHEVRSARPVAPVQLARARGAVRPRTHRTRSTVAALLHRAADSVAPAACTPSRSF
jgi:hypothetical protein